MRRLLLDTHALPKALKDYSSFSGIARALLKDAAAEPLISSPSAFELAIKLRIGKLQTPRPAAEITPVVGHSAAAHPERL